MADQHNARTDASRQSEEVELRRSEERFRKIFDHSNDAIIVMDPVQDRILDVNAMACDMLGYGREELLSTSITAIHPNEMPELRAFVESPPLHRPELKAVHKTPSKTTFSTAPF